MLRDCPDTSPELNKELLKKCWEEKKKKKHSEEAKKQKTAKAMKGTAVEARSDGKHDDGRFIILINDVVQDVALDYYGPDFNAIPNSTLAKVL